MNIRVLSEATYRGENKEDKQKLLDDTSIQDFGLSVSSARRGRYSGYIRALQAKAKEKPSLLLSEFGITTVKKESVPIVAIKNIIEAFLNGKKKKELNDLFDGTTSLVKKHRTVGLWIPITHTAIEAVSEPKTGPKNMKEMAFWFFSIIVAGNGMYEILNKIAPDQLRVDFAQNKRGYLIYLADKSWGNLS